MFLNYILFLLINSLFSINSLILLVASFLSLYKNPLSRTKSLFPTQLDNITGKPIDIASNTDKGKPSHNEVDKYISALAK